MEYNYFPVTLAQLPATIRFHDIAEGEFAIGEMRVTTQYLNHPALTLGYRLHSGGNAVVYSVDHEPHAPNPAARAEGEPPRHKEDQRHIDFLADADLVIHDSQYTIAEYPQKKGLGPHARRVGGRLRGRRARQATGSHPPRSAPRRRSGRSRRGDVSPARQRCRERTRGFRRGRRARIAVHRTRRQNTSSGPRAEPARKVGPHTILVADDPTIVCLLTLALEQDGFRVVTASDGEAALRLADSSTRT